MNHELIFISMHLPSSKTPQAGQKLAYSRLKEFTKDYNVHMISFVNETESDFLDSENYNECASVTLIPLSNFYRIKNLLCSSHLPVKIAIRNDSRMKKKLDVLLDKYPLAKIHIEFEQGAVYLKNRTNTDTTVVFHDVISQSLERFSELSPSLFLRVFYKHQHKKMLRWEKCVINRINNKIVLNEKDAMLIKLLSNSDTNVYIDYPVVSEMFKAISRNREIHAYLIFWGAMDRFENVDAVKWFVNDILPAILEKKPEAKLYIVGANPTEEVKLLKSENITVTGYVDDPIPFFEKAQIAVVPLRYGAGIKIKVIEALAAGLNVVTTDVGAEGIIDHGGKLEIANDAASFADTIIKIINKKNRNNVI
ncbi:glycosyltransferase involved in cell wall biosynthesis [Klebsiella oxytoca]|uniref:Glycosyltransferase involved in cell wall biosynthesis n=1 Tax=Klebsiella oxytoca TaxID=571 RepID=A0A318FHB3_KLEOX|nr:glycosyltransferase [Klebsiella oxytoca]PXW42880.1 glycosyltransferase involved in cell wall biosynthesis [Klebsiella oxytoca]HCB1497651.1 glycosyltransferase [Klebsiella michiganensis]HCB1844862.1 glycosyltransferase [Klebsiella oxytoca]